MKQVLKMKQVAILWLFLIFLFPSKGYCQEIWSLNDLLNQALSYSHEIRKSGLQQEESAYKVKETRANGLPQVDGSLNYSRMGFGGIKLPEGLIESLPEEIAPLLEGLADMDAMHSSSGGLTVSQLLYSKSFLTGMKQAKLAEEMQRVLGKKTEEDIIQDVSTLYYQVLMNYSNLNTLDKNIQHLETLHNVLKLQYENDFVKKTDVSRLKVSVTNLNTQKETLKNGIDIQNRVLKILSGIPMDREIMPDTTAIKGLDSRLAVIAEFVPEVLPEYQILEHQNQLARLQVESAKSAFMPTLAAFGQLTYTNYNNKLSLKNYYQTNTVGLQAVVPIFSSGMRKNKVMQSQLRLRQQEEDFDLAKKQLETGYQNSVHSLHSSWSNLNLQKENKDLAQEVYDQVKLQFNEGMASLTDLLNVESSLLEADNLYNKQLLNYKLSEIDMLKATGKLKTLVHP